VRLFRLPPLVHEGAFRNHDGPGRQVRRPRLLLVGIRTQGPELPVPFGNENSTSPSTTVIAVWSSIAYAGFEMPAAHRSASTMELPGMPSAAR
jgi:hypothetical protein